jgi:hypothetical protein
MEHPLAAPPGAPSDQNGDDEAADPLLADPGRVGRFDRERAEARSHPDDQFGGCRGMITGPAEDHPAGERQPSQ